MKLKVKENQFTNNETGELLAYLQMYCPISVNGLSYELNVKVEGERLGKKLILANLDSCSLIIKDTKAKKNGKEVIYTNAFIRVNIPNIDEPYDLMVKLSQSEIFLLKLCDSLIPKK